MVKYLVECSSVGASLRFSFDWTEVTHFGGKYHGNDLPFSLLYIRVCMISILLITGVVDLDNLVKMVSARFLHCTAPVFPFSYTIC